MSSRDQFNFDTEHPNSNPNPNMQDIMDNVDRESIDWDNFELPNNQNAGSTSRSHIFERSRKSQSQLSDKKDFQDSRDLMEISVIAPQNEKGSFRFEREDFRGQPRTNERYSKLQELLETAKKNSLEQFYKNMERQNKAYSEEPQKFANHKEFRDYVKQLKTQKRQKQQCAQEKHAANPFDTVSSNRMHYFTSAAPKPQQEVKQRINYQQQLRKPESNENPFLRKNVLPQEFENQDFFQPLKEESQPNPAQKFSNFYVKQNLPSKAQQFNKDEDAYKFFQPESNRKRAEKQKEEKVALEPIREEKHNSFEKTFEEEKLDNLLKNYQLMRRNFEDLMGELKSTNEGQSKLVGEIKRLKDEKLQNELKDERRERREQKEREGLEKGKKLDIIKDENAKIKSVDKDILFSQINKKFQQLEAVVRSALEEINQEKQAKIVPKVTNYFCDHGKHFINISNQLEKQGFEEFDPDAYKDKPLSPELDKNHDLFTQNIENLQISSRKKIGMPESPAAQSMNSRDQMQPNSNARSREWGSKKESICGSRARQNHQLYSPLDLQLNHNYSASFEYSRVQDQFAPQAFAEQYFPREFQGSNKGLRASLTQKSSVVFESFDFHVSARFSVVDDQNHPIVAAMRVGNKCSIDLYDVHSIIYGPHGPGISTDPCTIFQEIVKKNTSFAYQVSLDKSCLEDNGFSIQMSYKTDSMSKKKINFKVPLPLLQIIRPQFIYEQKFANDWRSLGNELFLRPQKLDSTYLRSHEDVKLILPFVEISQESPDCFSYGIMFRYPKCDNVFYLKVTCFVSGRASVFLRSQKPADRKLKQEMLNVFNFILYSSC